MSYALDTNGGNARHVQAAKKFGRDPDVVSALAVGNDDPAGVMGRFAIAARKWGYLNIRSVHRVSHYFDFPGDIVWDAKNNALIHRLVEEADIIHLNNSYRPIQRFHVRKPMLLHHHGSLFRNNTDAMLKMARQMRMVQAVSTIDLTRADTDILHWLPTAYDIDELAAFGEANRREDDGRIRVVSAPTNRAYKATDALIAAVKTLQDEGLPIDLVLVEGQTWRHTLEQKAKADIVFDQVLFGYGCNAIEAWALGTPVIAGADDWTLAAMKKAWKSLPFYLATEDTIADSIRKLAKSKDLRAKWADRGMAHIRKFHDEKPALERLAELYAITLSTYQRPYASAAEAVRFRSDRTIRMDNRVIAQPGVTTTDDTAVIARLRYFAKNRPAWGVEEVAE